LKKSVILLLPVFLLFPACQSAQNSSPEAMFKKSFPQNKFESIAPTKIKGLYEVYTGNQIYYYMPEEEIILAGSIITKDGKNLTRESSLSKIAGKMATLSLDDAFKIGNGKTPVVEFMDPDCTHCREAYNFFSRRKDVTLYVFFVPLVQDSVKKIQYILCGKNPVRTYEDYMSGKINKNARLNTCADKKVDETIKTHMRLASQTGIRGTPLFYIKGQVVDGFEAAAIEKLLKD
jgi:thiol:disulfide interchange protein DsbC